MISKASVAAVMAVLTSSVIGHAQQKVPEVTADGTVHVPTFDLPLSRYLSEEARRAIVNAATKSPSTAPDWNAAPIAEVRKWHDDELAPLLERAHAVYPVDITERLIANVRTRVITPKQGIAIKNRTRLLLNLHGGGFFIGANAEALIESIPVAVVAATKVITIDYRQGPEYKFPAASKDVIAVYRELLKKSQAKNIGVYGCSAGGSLTAMTVAAMQKQGMPLPGAIGLISSGAYADWRGDPAEKGTWGGDSRYWGPPVSGQPALPAKIPEARVLQSPTTAYLSDVDLSDALVSPAEWPTVLARFPPTLLLSGTRAYDMSAVVETHRQLIKNGASADLHLWDGMEHCFLFDVDLPESKEAYDVIAKFFDSNLGK